MFPSIFEDLGRSLRARYWFAIVAFAVVVGDGLAQPVTARANFTCPSTWGFNVRQRSAAPAGPARHPATTLKYETYSLRSPVIGQLVPDASGALYGEDIGGTFSGGSLFKLHRTPAGVVQTTLFSFGGSSSADYYPAGNPIRDAAGAFYGVTQEGGFASTGAVYKLTPTSGGYVETIVYAFLPYTVNDVDYCPFPEDPLAMDATGALYGITRQGGMGPPPGNGTVFKLTPTKAGYSESTIYLFGTTPGDGAPQPGALALDGTGALYGVTGATVYKLTPTSAGYRETILYSFGSHPNDGILPWGGVLFGKNGALYGTTNFGGTKGFGTVYEVARTSTGFQERVLHNFTGGRDGGYPVTGLVADANGALYGTTSGGGDDDGTVFRLVAQGSGWSEQILHHFTNGAVTGDGDFPLTPILLHPQARALYGATDSGGTFMNGIVFEIHE